MANTLYREEQNYRNWETIGFIGLLIAGLLYGIISGNATKTMAISPMWISACLVSLSIFMFYLLSIKLRVSVSDKNISYQYFPIHYKKKKVKIEDIDYCAVIDNNLAQSYTGGNLNIAVREQMYSVSGRTGVQLVLKNNKRLFIGTKNPEQLKQNIQSVVKK